MTALSYSFTTFMHQMMDKGKARATANQDKATNTLEPSIFSFDLSQNTVIECRSLAEKLIQKTSYQYLKN
ncbi:hypothetical protein M569_17752 [Genlisea aurea]|uniref:Uncharacterized protein n=1 Tax=Genlisea aurea TaxID=192259 RepID=S8D344_9LAMI|nr:hypothetical protein M569_17752 [Genlisea aurea]